MCIRDRLTTALQELQQRLNAQGDTAGTTAGELADDLQVQQSLNNIYSTLESTIKAMDDVPGLMDQFTQIVGSYSQQQLQAYICLLYTSIPLWWGFRGRSSSRSAPSRQPPALPMPPTM